LRKLEREQRDLVRLNFVDPIRSPFLGSAEAFGHVGYFAELIDEWAPEAHADERLFRLGSSMIDAIAAGVPVESLARYFEYWLLRLQGVYPALACADCQRSLASGAVMPPRAHAFACRRCAPLSSGTALSSGAMRFLASAGSIGPDRLESLALPQKASRELETAHRRLINLHLEKELKSARVLREMRQAR
jgi:DNA repair protein RecO